MTRADSTGQRLLRGMPVAVHVQDCSAFRFQLKKEIHSFCFQYDVLLFDFEMFEVLDIVHSLQETKHGACFTTGTISLMQNLKHVPPISMGWGGGISPYIPYSYVPPYSALLLSHFGLTTGKHVEQEGLPLNAVFEATTRVLSKIIRRR